MNQQVTPTIFYVGIDNPSETKFERQYPLPKGMSYNSYLIVDEKIAVMDSVESDGGDQWISQISGVIPGRTPDYLVVHHMEPDHSACIVAALDKWPSLTVVTSQKAIAMLRQFFPDYDFTGRTLAVAEGDTLPLGTHKLRFYTAPMVHWPEVIVSYEEHEQVLFSADAFGKFGALQYHDNWTDEARRYYINIVGKYGNQVQSLLRKLNESHISIIAPLHGPVLRGNLNPYLRLYDRWSRYESECRGVLVAYASIYGGTEAAALALAEKLRAVDAGEIVVMDLTQCDQSEAISQAFRLSGMVLASPTYDASLYPAMYDFLHHLTLKNYRNRRVGLIENGSWAPVAARLMRGMLEPLPGVVTAEPTVTIRSRLTPEKLTELQALAEAFTEKKQ